MQNAIVGVTVGIVEVVCCQPLNYWKNMKQQGLPLTLDPRKLYRGLGAAAVNMGGCTMIQFAVGGSLKRLVLGGGGGGGGGMGMDDDIHHRRGEGMEGERMEGRRLTAAEEMGIGFAAGVVSALAGSPLTLIMIQQQVRGGSSYDTMCRIANPNHFYRGFVGVAMREGLWTCGYLSFPPIVRRYLGETYPNEFASDATARIPAALLGGFFACYLSHPFDTIKTCMQGDVERRVYGTFTETARRIYEGGPTAFYRGATFRYGRMVCAVYLIDTLQVRKCGYDNIVVEDWGGGGGRGEGNDFSLERLRFTSYIFQGEVGRRLYPDAFK
jgi:hypothetical protein